VRLGPVLGVVLVAFGAWTASGTATYKTRKQVLHVGDLKASVREAHPIPAWLGFLSIGGGVVLLLASQRRRD